MAAIIVFKDEVRKLPLPATKTWKDGVWDISCLQNGTMSLILFTPRGKDYQTTHEQDELYIVHSGSGRLATKENTIAFVSGDVLFVRAGEDHHFEDFTDDLVLWAVFWGPNGGEKVDQY